MPKILFKNIEMIHIPEGNFIYGDNKEIRHLPDFEIMKYPVTVAQFREFCENTGRQMPPAPNWGWFEDHPIVNITWTDAIDFAKWANLAIPNDEQWEKASRGTDGRIYPWGDVWDKTKCHCAGPFISSTASVGSYPQGASPYGVQDMAGNVWEWCLLDEDKQLYSMRGGCWGNSGFGAFKCTCKAGEGGPDNYFSSTLGFRLIRK